MIRPFQCGRYLLDAGTPLIMGIVNLTDDSFSGDGVAADTQRGIESALQLLADGADILDLGAESSRPGAISVSEQQEIDRLLPVLEALRDCGIAISVDTAKPAVMRAVLAAGADMINDIGALTAPGAIEAVAASTAAVCLMHMQGAPRTMQANPHYSNVVSDVAGYLSERIAAATAGGIAQNRICIDPGFGFGKSLEHNLDLLRELSTVSALGPPVLIGMSRKSMLGMITGRPIRERESAGIAAHVLAVQGGARVVRVHEVAATRDALAVVAAYNKWEG